MITGTTKITGKGDDIIENDSGGSWRNCLLSTLNTDKSSLQNAPQRVALTLNSNISNSDKITASKRCLRTLL